MMLQALLHYAERRQTEDADFADPDFEPVSLHWLIPVSRQGKLLGTPIPRVQQDGKKKSATRVRRPFTSVNEISVRSLDKAKSYFLCDTLERVLLYSDGGKKSEDPLATARQTYFKRLLQEAHDGNAAPTLVALVIKFLETEEELGRTRQALGEVGAKEQENVTFQVEGEDLLTNQDLIRFWRSRRSTTGTPNGELQVCLVTGELTETVETTEKIKGIGGQDTNLISANEQSFRSFGLEKARNSPISPRAEKLTRAALNELISRGLRIQETVHLHWTRKPIDHDPFDLLTTADEQAVRNLLNSPRTGFVPSSVEANAYYALSLSGNGGRVVVRDWIETTVPELEAHVKQWFSDLTVVQAAVESLKADFRINSLLATLVPRKDGKPDFEKLAPQLPTELLHAALKGGLLPETALASALRRQQLDRRIKSSDPDPKLNPARMALIKAVLTRQDRFNQRKEKNNMTEQLNPESRDPAYLCGRLFAVFDRLQYLALGQLNAGVAERYYASASVTPALVMGRLFRNAQFHLPKAGDGLPTNLTSDQKRAISENVRKDFETIAAELGETFPQTLDLEGQGRFALGYYHQKADYRRRSAERKEQSEPKAEAAA